VAQRSQDPNLPYVLDYDDSTLSMDFYESGLFRWTTACCGRWEYRAAQVQVRNVHIAEIWRRLQIYRTTHPIRFSIPTDLIGGCSPISQGLGKMLQDLP